MALVLRDRVQETTDTTGTGSVTLDGATSGFQSFSSIGNGNTTFYCIAGQNSSEWEVGLGTYTASGTTLSRDTVFSSSNSGSLVNFSAGTKNVFVTYPSEKSINYDANGVATIGSTLGYSDTGVIASFASTETGYNQVIVQNKSTANTASANFNVSNDAATGSDNFAEFGINSSTFVGDSAFDLPGAAYLSSSSTPLTIGTYAAEPIHFITNGDSTTTDAMTIYEDGSVTLGGLPASGIGNISCNNINLRFQQVTTSGGTTTLTNASPYYTQFTGTSAQDLVLPNATTCLAGTTFIFDNDSTQNITIKDGAGTTFELLVPGGFHTFVLENNSTVAGTWLRYSQVPSTVEWGTNSLSLGSTVISGGTWQGGTIQVGYGGTGLTSLTSGGALYATSSSTMTSGTLPVTAGGTGQTAFSSGYIPYGNSTAALQSSSSLQFNGSYLVVGGTTPISGAVNPITAFTGSSNNYVQTYTYNANAGGSASADFVAYSNNSTDAHGWADVGYTSSVFNDASYSVTGPNEAYIFGSAPVNASATGNLVYATDSTGTANSHQWYIGGFNKAKNQWSMQLTTTGLQLANALAITNGGTGQTTKTAAYDALSPTTTLGDMEYNNGTNNVRLAGNTTATKKFLSQTGTGSVSAAPTWVTISKADVGLSNVTDNAQVISVSGTAPIASSGGTTPTISISQASSTTNGYLSSTDWNTFNGKGSGTVTSVSGTAPISVATGTTTPAISISQATTSTNGYLSSTDWNTFNNKQPAGSYLTSVTASSPLSGSGTAGSPLVIAQSTSTTSGYLSSTDWNTFNGKLSTAVTSAIAGTGVSISASTGAVTFSIGQAIGTGDNVQHNSLGIGTAASGTAGEIRATNNVTAYYSDERLKTKVGNIENALDKVKQIETMYYHANETAVALGYDASVLEVGVTAQSVQRVMPQTVAPAPIDDKYLTVRYERLVPLLIEAIKELEAQVAELKAK